MRRFLLSDRLADKMVVAGGEAHHMLRVLRLAAGDQVVVVDPVGQAAVARITQASDTEVFLSMETMLEEEREAPITIRLAQGLPKSDKMDFIVQKAVELGISEIIPMEADTSVVRYDAAKQQNRRERWQKIAAEAAKQCQRTIVPNVAAVQDLAKLLAATGGETQIIVLYEGQVPLGLKQVLREKPGNDYLLIIGPEGGLSSREVQLAQERGAAIVTMGPRILRTETAALAAIAAVMYEHGDLGG
ncbi:16S rRNA (uracil1498-N3)-methyltransferase [Anaerospora hongkongensis]|uniref:Ribosomal RNA small subunit methyltransferase E n=1 Tax=Anaerospora hongkongensis TaxID=244830 RepID=A0A4R1PYC4_9FIRM|nr:16S rRNA (uracil(1498)-N(3))-methyltransferase [Anaerospora hongkongensis]TCL36378.1 16S rRNA (uracil1498-N3)-methyltransferase [Anaerospora hongkongensis]